MCLGIYAKPLLDKNTHIYILNEYTYMRKRYKLKYKDSI